MNLKKIIKKIIIKTDWVKSIYDDVIYEDNDESFCGGSLSNSNILFIAEASIAYGLNELLRSVEKTEGAYPYYLDLDQMNLMQSVAAKMHGEIDHIINYINVTNEEDVYKAYAMLQRVTEYLVERRLHTTLCTIIYTDNLSSSYARSMKGLLESLSDLLPNHAIISNGIIAKNDLGIAEINETALFLSSKYGQMLNGCILEMGVNP